VRAVLGFLLLLATPAYAQPDVEPDEDVARTHYATGEKYYEAGRYVDALKEFEAARALISRPAFDFDIARCHDRLGHWAEAADAYTSYLEKLPNAPDADALRARIVTLRARVPKATSPAVPEPPPPKRLRVPAIVVGALAIGLGAAGTGAYLSAYSDYSSAQQMCNGRCDPNSLGDLKSRVFAAQVSGGVLWGLAAAAAVADIALWVVDTRRARQVREALHAGIRF
jgi:tetratricopeptide (TPR) repeat protein